MRSSLPDVKFNQLRLVSCLPSGAAEKLIVSVFFEGDVEFDFAQGYDAVEAVIQTKVPHPMGLESESSWDISEEFLDDLKNFNCLNVFLNGSSECKDLKECKHLNEKREDYPVFMFTSKEKGLSDATGYTFHVRYEIPVDPELDPTSSECFDARKEIQRIYGEIGCNRTLEFNLEHTYGTYYELFPRSNISVSADFTFPVISPADIYVRLKKNGDHTDSEERKAFIEVEYQGGDPNMPERAVLHFDKSFLEPVDPAKPQAYASHIRAWKSVGELWRASDIWLSGRFRRFDHEMLMGRNSKGVLADALAPVGDLDGRRWDEFAAKLKARACLWLDGDLTDFNSIEVKLTDARDKKIFQQCNVVEFQLNISRDTSAVPSKTDAWHFVRPISASSGATELFDCKGLIVNEVESNECVIVARQFCDFCDSLKMRSAPLIPNDIEDPASNLVRSILGSGGDPDSNGENVNWVVPEGIVQPQGGDARIEILPIGLQPIARTSYLGSDVVTVLSRAFKVLELAINGSLPGTVSYKLADWKSHFKRLEKIGSQYYGLVTALSKFALPLPDPEDPNLNQKIRPFLKAGRDETHSFTLAYRERLSELFLKELTQFFSQKAFLFSRLVDKDSGKLVSGDFYRYRSTRQIVAGRTNADGEEVKPLIEESTINVLSALSAINKSNYAEWFGFLEGLDDVKYDNEFNFSDLSLETFESVIDGFADSKVCDGLTVPIERKPRGCLTVPIEKNTAKENVIQLPIGERALSKNADRDTDKVANKAAEVYLASRRPVSDPVRLFLGIIDACQEPKDIPCKKMVSLEGLINGVIREPKGSETELKIAKKPYRGGRSTRLDDFTLSILYSVRGDEESHQSWTNAFVNDTFDFDLFSDKTQEGQNKQENIVKSPPNEPSKEMKTLIDALIQEPDPTKIENIEEGITDEQFLEYLKSLVQPGGGITDEYKSDLRFEINEKESGKCITIPPPCRETGRFQGECDFYLLLPAQSDSSPSAAVDSRFFILLNVEVTMWLPTLVTFSQGRNLKENNDAPARRFAPEFGSASKKIQPKAPFINTRIVDTYEYGPATLERGKSYSALCLIDKLLISSGILVKKDPKASACERNDDWSDYDLNITVFRDQRNLMPQAYKGSKGKLQSGEGYVVSAKHAITTHFFKKNRLHKKCYNDWFTSECREFVVEFQWVTGSNVSIFRVNRRRVTVELQ